MKYRADIDGLRSVAVIPVVLFHLGLAWMPGGFVGVDVFFVISGFLITSIIARELDEGRFSLARFYERRIRRIFPALFVVIAVVLLGGAFLLMPTDLYNAAQSAAAATLFASNFLFYFEAGYFDAASYTKPLLHTWSLAIEEQFYIVLPLLLMALVRLGRRAGPWILALTAVSFLLSALTTARLPTEAYYLLPWRAWELGIGSAIALGYGPRLNNPLLREGATALGIVLIVATALMLSKAVPFPGVAALAPTLGAALILHAGRFGPTLVSRLLSTAGPVWIGKLSYSLYLWHWPVIVAYVYFMLDLPDAAAATALFGISLLLAYLSWRFVEQPFRHPAAAARRPVVFGAAGVVMGVLLAVSAGFVLTKGLPGRLPPAAVQLAAFTEDYDPRVRECFWKKSSQGTWDEPCLYGAGAAPAQIALWSDSHGPAYITGLSELAAQHGLTVALYAHNGCPGIDGIQVYWSIEQHDCAPFLDATFPAIRDDPNIEMVIYAMRTPIYTQGWVDYGFDERDAGDLLIGARSGPLDADEDRTAYFFDGLRRTIGELRAAGKQVVLLYPLPEVGHDVPMGMGRVALRGGDPASHSMDRALFDARSADIMQAFDRIVAEYDLIAIRPHDTLCDTESCRLALEGDPIYRDSNHLNATTSRRLAPLFAGALSQVSGMERKVEN